jgi:hypothetical protein
VIEFRFPAGGFDMKVVELEPGKRREKALPRRTMSRSTTSTERLPASLN